MCHCQQVTPSNTLQRARPSASPPRMGNRLIRATLPSLPTPCSCPRFQIRLLRSLTRLRPHRASLRLCKRPTTLSTRSLCTLFTLLFAPNVSLSQEEEHLRTIESISLFGGLLCSISNLEQTSGGEYLLLAATVGTNKLFHFDNESLTLSEISRHADNKIGVEMEFEFELAALCGIGPTKPDLGNLKLHFRRFVS